MNQRLTVPFRALQIALGLTASLAGLDKFFNLLADWGSYVSPAASAVLPVSVPAFMAVVGIIEIAVGATILGFAPKLGAYVASGWLLLVAVNLAIGGYFDVAVRDVVMAIAAFTLARGLEAGAVYGIYPSGTSSMATATVESASLRQVSKAGTAG
jgi:hypothetical protein